MTRLSEHFDSSEFACRCGCGFDEVDPALVEHLEAVRSALGVPLMVLSGCRCAAHNAAVGGARSSQHLLGNAADLTCELPLARLYAEVLLRIFAVDKSRFGIGVYRDQNFIHFDTRRRHARWGDEFFTRELVQVEPKKPAKGR